MDVLFQPDAPPERRYLMAIEFTAWRHLKKPPPLEMPSITRFAASPDGYRWTMLQEEPGVVGQHHEVFCLYRYRDRYHIAGHQASPLLYLPLQRHPALPYCGPRTMVVWRSPDVDRWPLETCHAFFKPMQSSSPYLTGWDREEVHMGAYVTPYPNVCLGVCGQWHHPITGTPEQPDYRGEEVAVDLGFILSNDGVHFREPAPGFTFIGRDQELSWDRDWRDNTTRDRMLLEQGPLLNIGDRTVLYYTACTPHRQPDGIDEQRRHGHAAARAVRQPDPRGGCCLRPSGHRHDPGRIGDPALRERGDSAGRPAGSRAHRPRRAN